MCINSSHNGRIMKGRFSIFEQYPLMPQFSSGEMRYIKYNAIALFKNTEIHNTLHNSTIEGYAITTLKKGLEISLPQLKHSVCL